jgi:hypothetical protein
MGDFLKMDAVSGAEVLTPVDKNSVNIIFKNQIVIDSYGCYTLFSSPQWVVLF